MNATQTTELANLIERLTDEAARNNDWNLADLCAAASSGDGAALAKVESIRTERAKYRARFGRN